MTVTLTYDNTLARVRITADSLAAADYATVERSTDQILWTTVRGGAEVEVSAGSFVETLDDYEFVPGVANYYRVRGIETGAITYVAAGAATSGDNASLNPADPAGLVVGDLKIVFAAIRNSGTGTVNTPAGWTLIRQFGQSGGLQRNGCLLGRIHQSGDSAPTITFSGGVAGATTSAQQAAFRRAALTPVTGADQVNSSAQNIAYPALAMPADNLVALIAAWKQDDWTAAGASTPAGFTEIGDAPSTSGDDQGIAWDYQIQTTATDVAAGSLTITGGGAAISRSMTVALEHAPYLNEQTANVTPAMSGVWIKSVTRPFLNRSVNAMMVPESQRVARGSDFAAVGRTLPVGVTDVSLGRSFVLEVRTATADDAQTLDYVLASGDILFIHGGCDFPAGHYRVDTNSMRTPVAYAAQRYFSLPLTQIAAPGPDVVGSTNNWAAVLASYATWSDLLAANPDWDTLISRIASPSVVIVE